MRYEKVYSDPGGDTTKDRYENVEHRHHGKSHFFKDHIHLIEYPGVFPTGQFSYPFQYRIPDQLPGTFHKKDKNGRRKVKAEVQYSIKAEVDILKKSPEALTSKHPLVIMEVSISKRPQGLDSIYHSSSRD